MRSPNGQFEPQRFLIVLIMFHEARVREIGLQHFSHLCCEFCIRDSRCNFKIQAERSIVEINGSNRGKRIVNEDYFLVEKTVLVAIELYACRFYLIKELVG